MPVRRTFPGGTPCWIDCITDDPAASRRFYRRLFGWTFQDESSGYAIVCRDGRIVGGMGAAPPGHGGSSWTTYLASKDLDRTVATVREHGGRVVMPPLRAGSDGRLFLARDPAGAVVGFWQGDRPEGVVLTGEPGAMTWHELRTPSAAVLAFYRRLFDLTAAADGPTVVVALADRPAFTVRETVEAPRWVPFFGVRSVPDAVRQAVELGAVESGTGSGSPADVVLCDPGGAVFGVTAVVG